MATIPIFLYKNPGNPQSEKRYVGTVWTNSEGITLYETKRTDRTILRTRTCPKHQTSGICETISISEPIFPQLKNYHVVIVMIKMERRGLLSTWVTGLDKFMNSPSRGKDDWGYEQREIPLHELVMITKQ